MSRKPIGTRTPPQRQKEYDRFDNAMGFMAAAHDYKKHPVGAEASLDRHTVPLRSRREEWKRRKKKGETERPAGVDYKYDVWRWPKRTKDAHGRPKGGKFAKRPLPGERAERMGLKERGP